MLDVRDRIVLHIDGHIDFDWVRPETIGRIEQASGETDLRALQVHPWDLTARANDGFGIWNYLYPAARTGAAREIVWIVPDGTFPDEAGFLQFRTAYARSLTGVTPEEILGLRFEDGVVSGRLLGVPMRIMELALLPEFDEPVLFDLDLDYFTTTSPVDQGVRLEPRPGLDDFFDFLAARRLAADVATVSYSNVGGYLPYETRFIGPEAALALSDPAAFRAEGREDRRQRRTAALAALDAARPELAVEALRALKADGEADGPLEAALGTALSMAGREREAREADARARAADPFAVRLDLLRADVHRQNDRMEEALPLFVRFHERHPADEAAPYALRRVAFCLQSLRRMEAAVEVYRRVLALRPDHADSHANLAESLAAAGDPAGAAAAQREALRLRPWDPHAAWQLGTLLLSAGDPAAAEGPLRRGVEGKPASAAARYNLAACLGASGRLQEALAHAELAVALEPESAGFRRLAGELRALQARAPGGGAGAGPAPPSPR